MKVLVMCPGQFTHGLNSPERGEGRWSQNYARMLSQAGHDVYAASGGLGARTIMQYGVKLIDQAAHIVSRHGPFDLFFDAAWWEGKVKPVKAKKYVALKWSPENYLHEPFEDDFYLAYPYVSHHFNFNRDTFVNRDKSFALPTMFGDAPLPPNWSASAVFLPGKIPTDRGQEKYIEVIGEFLSKHPIEGTSVSQFREVFGSRIDFNRSGSRWVEGMPYDQVLEALGRSKISLPILNPGTIIESAFMGVPSVFWDHGGFFNDLSTALGIGIAHDASPEEFTNKAELLMNNKKKYYEVVHTMQDHFVAHTFSGAIKYFNLMCDVIGLDSKVSK